MSTTQSARGNGFPQPPMSRTSASSGTSRRIRSRLLSSIGWVGTTRSSSRPARRRRGCSTCARSSRAVRAAGLARGHALPRRGDLGRLLGVRDGAAGRRGRRHRPRRRAPARLAAAPAARTIPGRSARRELRGREGGARLEGRAARPVDLRRDARGARHVRLRVLRLGPDPPARPAARARADRRPRTRRRAVRLGRGVLAREPRVCRWRSRATAPTGPRTSSSGSRIRAPGAACCGPPGSTRSSEYGRFKLRARAGWTVPHVVHHARR